MAGLRRPKGLLEMGIASFAAAYAGRTEHLCVLGEHPGDRVERLSFKAGGAHDWTLSALHTPRTAAAPVKFVVITGAPSWAEYWSPTLAALPTDREMVVVDRPGYACSEPAHCVPDIATQAEALAPLLDAAPGQQLVLVGQSYGAAIAALMAANAPEKVASLLLLSGYFGALGPTAKRLVDLGGAAWAIVPKDLRHAIEEVRGQRAQLWAMRTALPNLTMPIHVIHGDRDDFAPIEVAEALARRTRAQTAVHFTVATGANHFLNDGPIEPLLGYLESAVPEGTAVEPSPEAANDASTPGAQTA